MIYPLSEWPTVLGRVLEKKEPLPQVADESHVSHETIRRVMLTATKEHVQHVSPLDHLS
jgi:translation initiation factor 2 gamma subunit (eIF-2gamma)